MLISDADTSDDSLSDDELVADNVKVIVFSIDVMFSFFNQLRLCRNLNEICLLSIYLL